MAKYYDLSHEEMPVDGCEISLTKLIMCAKVLKHKYGAKAVVKFDAGYNNIGVTIIPSKKVKHADT